MREELATIESLIAQAQDQRPAIQAALATLDEITDAATRSRRSRRRSCPDDPLGRAASRGAESPPCRANPADLRSAAGGIDRSTTVEAAPSTSCPRARRT